MTFNEKELVIWSPAWGDEYSELQKLAFRSITVDLETMKWKIHTVTADSHDGLKPSFLSSIDKSLSLGCRMLIMTADMVFGRGSILNMAKYSAGKPVTMAGIHTRINYPDSLEEIKNHADNSFCNWWLCRIAVKYAHQSFLDSFCEKDNGTRGGGISVTQLNDCHLALLHFLPSPRLCWFYESDLKEFASIKSEDFMYHIDHGWLKSLHEQRRLRFIGSSDLYFAVEFTRKDKNRIGVRPASAGDDVSSVGLIDFGAFVCHMAL